MTVDIAALHKAMASVIDGYSKDWVTRVGDNGRVQLGSIDECGEFADFVEIYVSDWSSDRDHDHELAAYFSAAHPSLIKKLIDQLEAAQTRIAELEGEQEPVGYFVNTLEDGVRGMKSISSDSPLIKVATPLYTVPPKPVVVPEMQQLKEAVDFYLQVQKENPPVEQGMHKDADEWIKRAEIEAAGIVINGGE